MFARALAVSLLLGADVAAQQFDATWDSLNARTPPRWFQDAKFGVFVHWGVYSVPAFCDTSTYSEWYQHWLDTGSHGGLVRSFHERVYGADFAYRDFAARFCAELWDPAEWARIFERAGARYVVVTSKHHDGFCLWPSAHASQVRDHPWNAMETGPKRDLLGELAAAVRGRGIRFGLYYSFLEWHNPLFDRSIADYVQQQMVPQVQDLVARYRPDVFWPDGEWEQPDATWGSTRLLQWLYANAPNADDLVVNDRWGKGLRGRTGDFYTTEYGDGGGGGDSWSGRRPFEECRGIAGSFAWNRAEGYDAYLSRTEAVRTLIDVVSRGGNLLLDVGPAADGTIPLIMVDRLFAIGDWLRVNGDAIFGTTKGPFRFLPWGRATQKGGVVYVHVYDWPASGRLVVPLRNQHASAIALGADGPRQVPSTQTGAGLSIDLRQVRRGEHATVVALSLDAAPDVDPRHLPDGDGVVTLPAVAAAVEGTKLKLETHVDRRAGVPRHALGGWSAPGDAAVWSDVVIEATGRPFRVELDCAVEPGAEGGVIEITVAERTLRASLAKPTGGWQDHRRVRLGTLELPAGTHSLRARAVEVPGAGLCSLRSIRLVPDASGALLDALVQPMALEGFARLLATMSVALSEGRHAAVAALYADDAILIGPDGERTAGREAIDAYWARIGKAAAWDLDVRSVRGGGGLVVQTGTSALTVERDGRRHTSKAEFVLTWQQQDDGEWRIVSDVYWWAR